MSRMLQASTTLWPYSRARASTSPSAEPGLNQTSQAPLSASAGMTLSADNRHLVVAHHRGNGVSIFDMEQDTFGAEIAWLAHVGENPHLVRLSPDGRYAVVANYVGEIEDKAASGTLSVIDMDPASETFLEVVTWLVNR